MNMSLDNANTGLSRLLRLSLTALVIYFCQIHPYVHVHHAHDESAAPIEFSVHPLGVESDVSCDRHDHDTAPFDADNSRHEHHESDRYIDWHIVRAASTGVLVQVDFGFISEGIVADPAPSAQSWLRLNLGTPLPESASHSGILYRGPPALG